VYDLQVLRGVAVPAIAQASHASGVLWHERLTHPELEKVEVLQQTGLVLTLTGTPTTKGECKGCAVWKATSTARESAPHDCQPQGVGERLHIAIAFPSVEGRRGEKCVLTTLEEGSRFVRVFPLATKGKAAHEILQLIADTGRDGNPVQIVHWNRDGEFRGNRLMNALRDKGIKLEYSPCTPATQGLSVCMDLLSRT
jgi:hypothetical protein